MSRTVLQPLAITMGDAAGIGPEIIAKAYREQPALMRQCFVVGDVGTMRRANQVVASVGRPALPVAAIVSADHVAGVPPNCIPVLQIGAALQAVPWGAVSSVAGTLAGQCITWAADAALRGEVCALVTAPLHKEALAAAGQPFDQFPGHTELLQDCAARFLGKPVSEVPVRMMLANDELRTVLVSIHVSLRDAIAAVSYDNVLQTLQITHAALLPILGRKPRIGVAGLNPHAGEGGLFGREELEVIQPAIAAAQALGLDASGPWAPDTVFMRARNRPGVLGEFDVVVAMYHDQGLIPVKYLGVEQGVNVTLGLPLVRTSPDHGTAFDIAGTGRADPASLVEAIRMARVLSLQTVADFP
ncbi:4-hydroxythreonine-4-phosphate dehydrogenase PdxA [Rhodoferax sp. AJA081-3]|uniref:4-hydroxythreonine-4-phosphate dehydrogenase PdxA n=1 Tax=Rhodoferax sp. AJA081-3 TaxID=2752316 RepID=UPI001ADF60DB|nr:4-hydroxythreonine-4-phosphate dehydrogenase PdxA [Rhodoferax sp. AJA081-3]QTN27710.1 4-hydroxythreonine-4-phosphate dehydrogenase PdxA [Rhodoferax sp. AJA081-3]